MNRGILVKLIIITLVLALIHSVFWFFKAGQLEKHINNYAAEHSGNISVGSVEVSGFPFMQKVTIGDLKFSIPNPAFSRYQILVKNVEASSGVFSNDFTVNLFEKISTFDGDKEIGSLEFTQQPQINFVITDGMLSHFSYQDSGHHVLDIDRNSVYAASSTSFTLDSHLDENDQIVSRIIGNIKDIENFNILEAYKNSSEKRIMDAIRTGEIAINSSALDLAPAVNIQQQDPSLANVVVAPAAAVSAHVVPAAVAATQEQASSDVIVADVAKTIDLEAAKNEPIKSNLAFDFEHVLSSVRSDQVSVPMDPSQIQESNIQYNKALKINNLEFSNRVFKIVINGQVNSFQDDNMPSGFITAKIENMPDFTKYVVEGFAKMAEQKPSENNDVQASDLSAASQPSMAQEDAYLNFLKRISSGFSMVSAELSAKNPLTKESSAVFDIRREKNLEFVINETPLREVLGKF